MNRPVAVLRTACRPEIVCTALKVSLVVGVVLNGVNRGGVLLDGGAIDWSRGLLNFLVPYCVSSYSAALDATRRCRENTR